VIPYIVKKHYFNLLFEVYLRKVPGMDESYRLNLNDIKFVQIMKYVVQYDLEHGYNFYVGLIVDPSIQDSPEISRKKK
jgi:hypothetical protein